jgi:hypothetical protein
MAIPRSGSITRLTILINYSLNFLTMYMAISKVIKNKIGKYLLYKVKRGFKCKLPSGFCSKLKNIASWHKGKTLCHYVKGQQQWDHGFYEGKTSIWTKGLDQNNWQDDETYKWQNKGDL